MPSNHDASRIVDTNGIAPTVKENHGTVTAVLIDDTYKNREQGYMMNILRQSEQKDKDLR